MADIKRHATASWSGSPKDGSGELTAESGKFSGVPYSFPSRFEHEEGSNPEEFIGAAHAACYNMVIALELANRGTDAEKLETRAEVVLKEDGGGHEITTIHLETKATVPGIDEETFQQIAETARDNCPVSQLLKPGLQEVTISASLN